MTVRKGGKIIAGNSRAVGSGWEIGDIGIAALGIDETKNKRRYLNGQVISQTQFAEFATKIKNAITLYPALGATEVNWQAEVTNSKLGQCGKFVIDDVAGTIRLPKVVNINGLQDLIGLGGIKAESLPNITGAIPIGQGSTLAASSTGAFTDYESGVYWGLSGQGTGTRSKFDASLSSSTYQDNAPVQQEAVQYPYFIQVATGVETSVDVSREIELNNPFSLLDYKYSEYELSNASWLLSNGQWNSRAVYQSVYDLLLQIYNGTVTKAGVSVKLSTETYTDTDFVLNTSDTTFRLPIKVLMAGSKRVAGNGMTLGLTNGTENGGLTVISNYLVGRKDVYNTSIGAVSSAGDILGNNASVGITTDPLKSGIETSANGLYLYFYVGETVQDANIIAAGQVLTDVAKLKAHYIVETYINGTSWYRVYSDGWCEQGDSKVASQASWKTITLLKQYKDTNYQVLTSCNGNVNGTSTWTTNVDGQVYSTSQIQIKGTNADANWLISWETKGYMA